MVFFETCIFGLLSAGCTYVEVGLDPTKLVVRGQVTQKEVVAAALR